MAPAASAAPSAASGMNGGMEAVPTHQKPTLKEFVTSVDYITKNKEAEGLVLAAFASNKITVCGVCSPEHV